MGRKSKILYYTVLFVNLGCFVLDLIPGLNFPFFRVSFAVSLMLIGLLLVARAVMLKLDSGMFIGVLLFLFGVLNMLLYFGQLYNWLTVRIIVPFYLFAVAISSLITALYFKDKLQLKLFILFLGFGGITLLFSYKMIGLWWYVGIMVGYFILYFIVNLVMFKKRSRNG